MTVPLRILRAEIEKIVGRPEYTDRHINREARILEGAVEALANHGRHGITFAALAAGLRVDKGTLRWHFADLDILLATILHQHIHQLEEAVNAIPIDGEYREEFEDELLRRLTHTPEGDMRPVHIAANRAQRPLQTELTPLPPELQPQPPKPPPEPIRLHPQKPACAPIPPAVETGTVLSFTLPGSTQPVPHWGPHLILPTRPPATPPPAQTPGLSGA
jgi:AcrR family transcriptional regulator